MIAINNSDIRPLRLGVAGHKKEVYSVDELRARNTNAVGIIMVEAIPKKQTALR